MTDAIAINLETEYNDQETILSAIQSRDYKFVAGGQRTQILRPITIYDTNSASTDSNVEFKAGITLTTLSLNAMAFFDFVSPIENENYGLTMAFKSWQSPFDRVKLSVGFSEEAKNLYKKGNIADLEVLAFNPAEVAFIKLSFAEQKAKLIFERDKVESPDQFRGMTFEDFKKLIMAKGFGSFCLKNLPGITTYKQLFESRQEVLDRNGEVIKDRYGNPITPYRFAMEQRIPDDRKSISIVARSEKRKFFS